MADETIQTTPVQTEQTDPGGVAPATPAETSTPAAPAAPATEAAATPGPDAPAETPTPAGESHKGDVEYFKAKYQVLVQETGLSINVEPKYGRRDDGTYSTFLETTILPAR